jgi:hypothetical protein
MLFLNLLLAHLLSDFVFQPGSLIEWKHRSCQGIMFHACILFLVNLVILWPGSFHPLAIALLFGNSALHFAADKFKISHEKKTHRYVHLFLLDQAFHLLVLSVLAFLLSDVITPGPLVSFVGTSQYAFTAGYLILAIVVSCVFEIFQYQFALQKDHKAKLKCQFAKIFRRLLVFTLLYGIVMVLGVFQYASTLVF